MKDATLGQALKILQIIKQKGVSSEQLQALLGSGLLSDFLEADVYSTDRLIFRRVIGSSKVSRIYTVVVNYDRSGEGDLLDVGYDFVNESIKDESFMIGKERSGTEKLTMELVEFGEEEIDTKDVFAEFEKRSLVPAGYKEFLSLGEKLESTKGKLSVVALGAVWKKPYESDKCLYIGHSNGKYILNIASMRYRWPKGHSFAAVHKGR